MLKTKLDLHTHIAAGKRLGSALLVALASLVLLTSAAGSTSRLGARPQTAALTLQEAPLRDSACDPDGFNQAEQQFVQLSAARDGAPANVSKTDLRSSAALYITEAEKCFVAHAGLASSLQSDDPPPPIDDGGMWMPGGPAPKYLLTGTKWGASQLGTPGGTVTYSYVANNVTVGAHEGYPTQPNVAIQSLSTYSACFLTDIANAFAAWSAVANIQFVQVADNGQPFDAPGAQGDIRIGAHAFNGPGGVLAHAYYPPPNGSSAAGDVHFNSLDNWSCDTTWIDIGIVTMHELGHSIGLFHQPAPPAQGGIWAVMNPIYNPGFQTLQPDDASGAVAIYGPAPAPTFAISGNAGVSGVTLSYFNGSPQTVISASGGGYSFTVPLNWSGTVTPSKLGYTFSPTNRSYSNVASNQTGQSYAATLSAHTDFDGDFKTDLAKFAVSTGTLAWFNSSNGALHTTDLGTDAASYVPRSDFDGDGKADPAKFVSSSQALWYLKSTTATWEGVYMGPGSYDILPGSDFDGDQKTDPATFVAATGSIWRLPSSTGVLVGTFIGTDAAPTLSGSDYDGDGKTDLAKYVPAAGAIWYLGSSTGTWQGIYIGSDGTPVADSDFDGDGKTDPAKVISGSNSLWYRESSSGIWKGLYLGPGSFIYVTASDFDGDGKTDPAKFDTVGKGLWYRPSGTGTWTSKYMGGDPPYDIVN